MNNNIYNNMDNFILNIDKEINLISKLINKKLLTIIEELDPDIKVRCKYNIYYFNNHPNMNNILKYRMHNMNNSNSINNMRMNNEYKMMNYMNNMNKNNNYMNNMNNNINYMNNMNNFNYNNMNNMYNFNDDNMNHMNNPFYNQMMNNMMMENMFNKPINDNPMNFNYMNNFSYNYNFYLEKINFKINEIKNNIENCVFSIKKYLNHKNIDSFIIGPKTLINNEPYQSNEIKNENDKITYFIGDMIYDIKEEEKQINEIAGNLLYSIGGIARKSVILSNEIYSELFNEYKKINFPHLVFDNEEDRIKLSSWTKQNLNPDYFHYYSEMHKNEIEIYLISNNSQTREKLFKLFEIFLRFYTKCILCVPIVKVDFEYQWQTGNNEYDYNIMIDITNKIKQKVNFCYWPQLKCNEGLIPGGKFYVFTFIDGKTYKKEGKLYEDEKAVQNWKLDY